MTDGLSDHLDLDSSPDKPSGFQPVGPTYVPPLWLFQHHNFFPQPPPHSLGLSVTTFPSLNTKWTKELDSTMMNPRAATFTPFPSPEPSFATPSMPTPRHEKETHSTLLAARKQALEMGHKVEKESEQQQLRKHVSSHGSGPAMVQTGCDVPQDHATSPCSDDQPLRPTTSISNKAGDETPVFRLKIDSASPASRNGGVSLRSSTVDSKHHRQGQQDSDSDSDSVKDSGYLKPVVYHPRPKHSKNESGANDGVAPKTTHAQPQPPKTPQPLRNSTPVMPVPVHQSNTNPFFGMGFPPQHHGNMMFPPVDPAMPFFPLPPMMPYPPPAPYFHSPYMAPYHGIQVPMYPGIQGYHGQQMPNHLAPRPPSRKASRPNISSREYERPHSGEGLTTRQHQLQSQPPVAPRGQFTPPIPHVEGVASPSPMPYIRPYVEATQPMLVSPTANENGERGTPAEKLRESKPKGGLGSYTFDQYYCTDENAEQLSEQDGGETGARTEHRRPRRGRKGRTIPNPNLSISAFWDERGELGYSNHYYCTESDGGNEDSASQLQSPPLNAPTGPATHRRVPNIPKTSNRVVVPSNSSEPAAWSQSKRWMSLETKERMAFQKMMLNLHFMGADKSPFVPQSPAELTAFRAEVAEVKRQQLVREVSVLLEKTKRKEKAKKQEAEKHQILATLFRGKELKDKCSPVFAAHNCFNLEELEDDEERHVEWPSLAELKEEGDKRAAKYGRYLPLPRMNIVATRILEREREKAYNPDGSIF